MAFQPFPGQSLEIDGANYEITEHPNAPGMPFGQEGRQAVVYQLATEDGSLHALKVFKQRFSSPALVSLTENIEQYASLPGLKVCKRIVLTPQNHLGLLQQFPDLTYAVLMLWIDGSTWTEMMLGGEAVTPKRSLALTRDLTEKLVLMEQKNIAHCDISGANVIIIGEAGLEFVDVEGIYAPGLPQPEVLPAGSPGYAHRTAPQGLWNPQTDRFAGAVMLAEILGWCDEKVRRKAWGENYFNSRHLQQDNESYGILYNVLKNYWGEHVASLFARAWQSSTLSDCPTFGQWLVALPTKTLGIRGPIEEERIPETTEPEPEIISEPEVVEREQIGAEKITCPYCRKALSVEVKVCPECEQHIDWEALDQVLVEGERRKKFPVWGWLVGGLVIICLLVGSFSIGKLLKPETGAPTSAMVIVTDIIQLSDEVIIDTVDKPPIATVTIISDKDETINVSDVDSMTLIYIQAGEFQMGSEGNDDESPEHWVFVDAFWIDQTEVSNDQFAVFLNNIGNQVEGGSYWIDVGDKHVNVQLVNGEWKAERGYEDHPMVEVSWYGAAAYCEWAGRRLPTEAEWEKAARGEEGFVYPWGNWFDSSLANVDDETTLDDATVNCGSNGCDGYERTSPVGSFTGGASPYGVLDMAGNVLEWVQDWFDETYYSRSPKSNPPGSGNGLYKVVRGGSWYSEAIYVRSANRSYEVPNETFNNIGFRCVYSP